MDNIGKIITGKESRLNRHENMEVNLWNGKGDWELSH